MKSKLKLLLGVASLGVAAASLSACNDQSAQPPVSQEPIDTTDADECPRADGEPCR